MSGALSTGPVLTRRRLFVLAGGAIAGATVSCGGNGGGEFPPTVAGSPSPSTTVLPSETETPKVLTELRVAYVNLLSPVTTDSNNTTAKETFEQRLEILIEELKEFKPDIVGFGEVYNTDISARELLFKGLQLEFQYVRSNPWILGPDGLPTTKELSDEMAKLVGYEEGEMLMVRAPLTIKYSKRGALNPRNSESEGRACLWATIDAPEPLGGINVYLTHLTSDNERVRQLQTDDMLAWIQKTRGERPAIILGDLNDVPGSTQMASVTSAGFLDVASAAADSAAPATCCREAILGEQPDLVARTDYILASGLGTPAVSIFGNTPKKRADGSLLYASDHNGLMAVFQLSGNASSQS